MARTGEASIDLYEADLENCWKIDGSELSLDKSPSLRKGVDALPALAITAHHELEDPTASLPTSTSDLDECCGVGEALTVAEFESLDQHGKRDSGLGACERDKESGAAADEKIHQVSFYRLFSFADGVDYLLMGFGTLGACTHGVAVPVFFIFFGRLIDAFGANYNNPFRMGHEVSKYSLYLFYLGLVVMGASWLEVWCWMQTGERQSARMRSMYLKAVLSQNMTYFDTRGTTNEIATRIANDTALVQDAISEKAGNFLHFTAKFIVAFAVGFCSVWQLSLITLAVVPAIVMSGAAYTVIMTGHATKGQKAYEEAGKVAEQVIAQVRTVYSFVGEARAVKDYSTALQTTLILGKKCGMTKGVGLGVTYGLCVGAWALLLWYSGVLVRHGTTNGGKAFTTILNVIVGGIALGQAAPNLTAFSKGRAAAYNILEILKRGPPQDEQAEDEGLTLENVEGRIEFRNVCFNYPSRPTMPVFQNFCLQLPAGKTVALVGTSGCGKSTVVSLLERFYDPNSGEVLLDGHNLKTLRLKWLRAQIGLVNQEPALFATSIRENLLYGKNDATAEEIVEAAKASNSHSFISQLPFGYDTQVGERGIQLSGGEKQRLAIARAMLRNPKILLLDEATSALDPDSEQVVQEALDRLIVGRSTIVIAHQLSTIRNADSISVIRQGKVIETGTHNALMSKGERGVYALLARLQEAGHQRGHAGQTQATQSTQRTSNSREVPSVERRTSFNESEINLEVQEKKPADVGCSQPALWRMLRLNKPEWHYGVLGAIGAVLAGCEFPLVALTIGQLLVTFYVPDKVYMEQQVHRYTLFFTGAIGVVVIANILQHYFFAAMGECLTKRIREMMFTGILRNEIGWFDKDQSNSCMLASRLSVDAASVRAGIGDRICTVMQNMSLVITAFVIAFILEWRVASVMVATFPLLIVALVGENFFLKGFGGDLPKAYARAGMVVGEAVGNIRTVAAFCAEEKVLELFERELQVPRKKTFVKAQVSGLGYGISQFFMYSSYALALWYSSTLVKKGETAFGNAIKIIMVLIFAAFGVAETIAMAPDFVKAGQALGSIFQILDRETEINPDDPESEMVTEVLGEIEFRHVAFSYPMRPEVSVFKDFNLRVRAGKSLALVGASGSGKSSVVALIQRFYDPSWGRVLIDGKDIKKLNLRALRRHIGYVQQEPPLFASSIYDNIVYGKEEATEGEVVQASKTANAHNFISALPEGYRTEVGDRGVQLSGGQKQRVAIARAVIKNPEILLLDEATSALDAQSERLIQEALDRIVSNRTTVVIAHRLSTIRHADVIAVMKDGQIIEQGTHRELLNMSCVYANLIQLQQHRHSQQIVDMSLDT
ncbi:autophagy-related protein 9 [Marchantia polymorpha subsp. ruderalis]|uniref:Uncharacterized protein n=2 Tax=Marchantia polymorpha TaxID=3197 RepID=A0AAF6BJC1_MARPO|nr:hypothetical protein MARPO_0182s0009 [Marchantia polymorpha]BBN12105.1 hypothetical protein Mp_5g17400 [Marchantia polymorpha subsp. ruderalis]|eukprot:PTQ27827.1 hypothetical protein MARPO_0182s0009 [Marchantia polymorpha]